MRMPFRRQHVLAASSIDANAVEQERVRAGQDVEALVVLVMDVHGRLGAPAGAIHSSSEYEPRVSECTYLIVTGPS